jgi:hypothetical protein
VNEPLGAFEEVRHHIELTAKTHPHADATYSIVPQKDMTCGVEASIPGTHPALVTGLATEQDAAAWIEKHKQRVLTPSTGRKMFQRSRIPQ